MKNEPISIKGLQSLRPKIRTQNLLLRRSSLEFLLTANPRNGDTQLWANNPLSTAPEILPFGLASRHFILSYGTTHKPTFICPWLGLLIRRVCLFFSPPPETDVENPEACTAVHRPRWTAVYVLSSSGPWDHLMTLQGYCFHTTVSRQG